MFICIDELRILKYKIKGNGEAIFIRWYILVLQYVPRLTDYMMS